MDIIEFDLFLSSYFDIDLEIVISEDFFLEL